MRQNASLLIKSLFNHNIWKERVQIEDSIMI